MALTLKYFVSLFAGLTVGYWVAMLLGLPQHFGLFATLLCGAAMLTVAISFYPRDQTSAATNISLALFALIAATFVCSLYAFNPDDATFFHRVNHLNGDWSRPLPHHETRLAYDLLPPISAAHLATSWEYILSTGGAIFGSPVAGYQLGGTIISILFYIGACLFTVQHFFPKATAIQQILTVAITVSALFLDADANRRIGAWLFLGGWTGKCFLAASLILLFPALHQAVFQRSISSWLFLACLIIFYIGLTGSALFILPIGLASGFLITLFEGRRNQPPQYLIASAVIAIPLLVGAIFIARFGRLLNDSYWRGWESMPFLQYIRLTVADHQLWLFAGLFGVVLSGWKDDSTSSKAIRYFASYQLLLAIILFNPITVALLKRAVPSDGFWRTYYLFQYPTAIIILVLSCWNSLKTRNISTGFFSGAILLLSVSGGTSVFALQSAWGYPQHLMSVGSLKLEKSELNSVQKASSSCPAMKAGKVVLAPERWEVVAQMLFPQIATVATRHMHHNFLNNTKDLSVPESTRAKASLFVSGDDDNAMREFKAVLENGVDIVVFRATDSPAPSLIMAGSNYHLAGTTDSYTIFCLN